MLGAFRLVLLLAVLCLGCGATTTAAGNRPLVEERPASEDVASEETSAEATANSEITADETPTEEITVTETATATEPTPANQAPGDLTWREIRDDARRLLESQELDILATDGSLGTWYQGRILGHGEAIWTHEGQTYSLGADESGASDSSPSISPQEFRSIVLAPLAALTPSETTKWGFGTAVELRISELDAQAWAPLVTITEEAVGAVRVNFAVGIGVDNYTVVYDFRNARETGAVGPATPFVIQATFASPEVADEWVIDLPAPTT